MIHLSPLAGRDEPGALLKFSQPAFVRKAKTEPFRAGPADLAGEVPNHAGEHAARIAAEGLVNVIVEVFHSLLLL